MALTNKEISDMLLPPLSTYQGFAVFGPSSFDQWRNANAAQDKLQQLYDQGKFKDNKQQYDNWNSILTGQKFNAAASGAVAGLGAASQIYSTANDLAQIADTTQYQNMISDMDYIGRGTYNNVGQIASEYERTSTPSFEYDDIRGASGLQRAGQIGSSALAGASAGMTIGGPWGAAIGGAIGLGAGLIGNFTGNRKARTETAFLNNQAELATATANQNLSAGHENLRRYQFRNATSHIVADGGKIERKQESLKQFADRVMRQRRNNDITHSSGIVRQRCKGGTMIRIKVK